MKKIVETFTEFTSETLGANVSFRRDYEKYEFCIDVGCAWLRHQNMSCMHPRCKMTAKEFHKWIKSKGGEISMPLKGAE